MGVGMSKVIAETEDIIFKARIASFYEISLQEISQLNKDFELFLKQKGRENDFLVWNVQTEIQVKK
jgi:hypothetical protein